MGGILSLLSFVSGIVFGVFASVVIAIQLLSSKNTKKEEEIGPKTNAEPVTLDKTDVERLKEIIDHLDDISSPLKNVKNDLQRIHNERDGDSMSLEMKMKTIIEMSAISKLEKEFSDSLLELKDHGKQIKGISNFLADFSKVHASFAKDLTKLSTTAKSNMNKNSSLEKKEELIINNWWQALQVSLDHLASDQDNIANILHDELSGYLATLQEEVIMYEKKLNSEGTRHFAAMRENLISFESKLRERDKYREKLKSTSDSQTSERFVRRAQRLKTCEDSLRQQTKKLYEVQKELYVALPRIRGDVELAILKTIVSIQSQLFKLTETIDKTQETSSQVTKRMKNQLTNAAASLVQMIKEEGKLSAADTSAAAAAATATAATGTGPGVQGYEQRLQRVLEGLLVQSQLRDVSPSAEMHSASPVHAAANGGGGHYGEEEKGHLNMNAESTATLAAVSPKLLPLFPPIFNRAVGLETCVWFNALLGRIYRDVSCSKYFYYWFCAKYTLMLNRGNRPAFIDEFKVVDIQFGSLPPLFLNVKWMPQCTSNKYWKKHKSEMAAAMGARNGAGGGEGEEMANFSAKETVDGTGGEGNDGAHNAEERDTSPIPMDILAAGTDAAQNVTSVDTPPPLSVTPIPPTGSMKSHHDSSSAKQSTAAPEPIAPGAAPAGFEAKNIENLYREDIHEEDLEYYICCSADIAFRSSMSFTITTNVLINWPRDRYATVPVTLVLEITEVAGRAKFGVTKGYSFFSFLKEPLIRINVRSEVGNDTYKFKDVPLISDYIVKKVKSFVREKFCAPNSHKFRLIWPRNWWPEGTENSFLPQPLTIPESVHVYTDQQALKVSTESQQQHGTNTTPVPSSQQQSGTQYNATHPPSTVENPPSVTFVERVVQSTEHATATDGERISKRDLSGCITSPVTADIGIATDESQQALTSGASSVKSRFTSWLRSSSTPASAATPPPPMQDKAVSTGTTEKVSASAAPASAPELVRRKSENAASMAAAVASATSTTAIGKVERPEAIKATAVAASSHGKTIVTATAASMTPVKNPEMEKLRRREDVEMLTAIWHSALDIIITKYHRNIDKLDKFDLLSPARHTDSTGRRPSVDDLATVARPRGGSRADTTADMLDLPVYPSLDSAKILPRPRRKSVSDAVSDKHAIHTNTKPVRLRKRAMSISDFRQCEIATLFNDLVLENYMAYKKSEYTADPTRGAASGSSGGGKKSRAGAKSATCSSSSSPSQNKGSGAGKDSAHSSSLRSEMHEMKAWFSSYKRAKIDRAKEKYAEFKQKHFHKDGESGTATGSAGGIAGSSPPQKVTLGDRLKDILFNEDSTAEHSTAAGGGGGGGGRAAGSRAPLARQGSRPSLTSQHSSTLKTSSSHDVELTENLHHHHHHTDKPRPRPDGLNVDDDNTVPAQVGEVSSTSVLKPPNSAFFQEVDSDDDDVAHGGAGGGVHGGTTGANGPHSGTASKAMKYVSSMFKASSSSSAGAATGAGGGHGAGHGAGGSQHSTSRNSYTVGGGGGSDAAAASTGAGGGGGVSRKNSMFSKAINTVRQQLSDTTKEGGGGGGGSGGGVTRDSVGGGGK